MSYYKVFGLDREPFSTSPDPRFFYGTLSHLTALRRLEINIRLKRGLSLVFGDVGTGKTVLCRVLAQEFRGERDVEFHLLFDPDCESKTEFLAMLARMFRLKNDPARPRACKEAVERYLFRQGVDRGKTVVCVIDEGQKLSIENLELLRTLLNYETNEYKLLQLVIMAQVELTAKLDKMPNFTDRASLKYTINPLDERECARMVAYRLKQAGYNGRRHLFSDDALRTVSVYARGYPRRIAMLCHESLKNAVMQGRYRVEADGVEKAARSLRMVL
ncbi:MAG: AAA family ATPase [Candidatus Omnitrophica bacterium]|nr:AAA family ATPase [Candidatus Omnitrophota bacterium]